jgi:glycosyltransferase involved in cell wall biosynthesis
MAEAYPLISCICVTRNRPALLQRALDCFLAQTYPRKELVILFEQDDAATCELFQRCPRDERLRLICVERSPNKKLGHLRNHAIHQSSGDFVCQWDDDDWYHQDRLAHQYAALRDAGRQASILSRWMMFDATPGNHRAYISYPRLWEGSVLCRKELIQQREYANVERGEDTPVVRALSEANALHVIEDAPHLYVYTVHGSNTWEREHFGHLFGHSMPLPPVIQEAIHNILQQHYSVADGSGLLDKVMPAVKKALAAKAV